MKFQRKPSIVAIATAVVVFNFTSCKYEDGPGISLRTKKSRLSGEWEVQSIEGQNLQNSSITIEFEKNGDFEVNSSYSYYGYNYSNSVKGEWEWEDGKRSIELSYDGGGKEEWEITRLTNKEFEFEDEDNDKWELEKD